MKVNVKGGTVYLRDRLDYQSGYAVRFALAVASEELKASYGVTDGNIPDEAVPDLVATITLHELLHGIERWSFKEPVTRQNIHALILDDPDRSMAVGAAADKLYQDQVIGPLTSAAASSSPPSPTDESTSAQNGLTSTSEGGPIASIPSPKPRKRSKPSSTSTTQTGVTVTTSA